tara:strand:+ start:1532 stop:2431 length:900 start_codon:yes stop_codon:yes gene_type:complete
MGTPDFSINTLKSLINDGHKILRVYTQSPKKKQRGHKIIKTPVHFAAEEFKLDVKTSNNLNNDEDYSFFKNTKIDLVVVVAYGNIIPEKFLKIPKLVFLNLHASLLPKWRGAAPIERSILSHEKETGISIMKIVSKLDEGPYMMQIKLKIRENMSAGELRKNLSVIGAKAMSESLKLISEDKAMFKEQDHLNSSYAKKIKKSETQIDWNDKAKNINAKINAFNPKPGAWFFYKKERVKVFKALEVKQNGNPGEILDNELTIGTGLNAIKILELQKEGKKILNSKEFLKGNKLFKGTKLF